MENEKNIRPPIGVISVVVIFVVLCLAVFSVLSLSAAETGYESSKKMADSIQDYYAADSLCCKFANDIWELAAGGTGKSGIITFAENAGAVCKETEEGTEIRYSRDVDSARRMDIVLLMTEEIEIISWQTVSRDEWEYDDTIPVWTGQSDFSTGGET